MINIASDRLRNVQDQLFEARSKRKLIQTAAVWQRDLRKYLGNKPKIKSEKSWLYQKRGFVIYADGNNNARPGSFIQYFGNINIQWDKGRFPVFGIILSPTVEFKPAFEFYPMPLLGGKHKYALGLGLCQSGSVETSRLFRVKMEILEHRYVEKLKKYVEMPIKLGKEHWMRNQIVIPFTSSNQPDKKAYFTGRLLYQANRSVCAIFTHIQLVQLG